VLDIVTMSTDNSIHDRYLRAGEEILRGEVARVLLARGDSVRFGITEGVQRLEPKPAIRLQHLVLSLLSAGVVVLYFVCQAITSRLDSPQVDSVGYYLESSYGERTRGGGHEYLSQI